MTIRTFWGGNESDHEMGKANEDEAQKCLCQKMTYWKNFANAGFPEFNRWDENHMDYCADAVICGDDRETRRPPILGDIINLLYGICGNPELSKEFRQKAFHIVLDLQEEEKKFEPLPDWHVKSPPVSSLVMGRTASGGEMRKFPIGASPGVLSARILPLIRTLVVGMKKAQYSSAEQEQRAASLARIFQLMEESETLKSDLVLLIEAIAPLDSEKRTTREMHGVVYERFLPDHKRNDSAPPDEDDLITSFLDWYEARFSRKPHISAFVSDYSAKGKKLDSFPDKLKTSGGFYQVADPKQVRIVAYQRLLIIHARIAAEKVDREILKLLKYHSSRQVGFDSFDKMICFSLAWMDVLAASLLKVAGDISRTNQRNRQQAMYAGFRAAILLMFGQTWTAWYQDKCRRWHETTPLRDQMAVFRQQLALAEEVILKLPQQAEHILNLVADAALDERLMEDETRKLFDLVMSIRVHLEWVDHFARWTAQENGNKD